LENHESVLAAEGPDEFSTVSLARCVDVFNTKEQLGENDLWYCNICREHVQATKKLDLWKLPDILVIHLKRFSYKNRSFRDKLDTLVDYPLEGLDLSAYQLCSDGSKAPVYDLFAVSVSCTQHTHSLALSLARSLSLSLPHLNEF
jgi:ubiquitin C-terminal hydrolase